MRNENWGWAFFAFFLIATFGLTGVVELLLPPVASRWTAAAMAVWILAGSLAIAALRAPYSTTPFWTMTLFLSAILSWFTLYICAKSWNLVIFPPNGAMLTIFMPVATPSGIQAIRTSSITDPEDRAKITFKPFAGIELLIMYIVAVTHLVLCFHQITLSTRLYLAFFALVSIASWRLLPTRHTNIKPSET